MDLNHEWHPGDRYWALWVDATRGRYFPVLEGVVGGVQGPIIRLIGGAWRFVNEGIAFSSRQEAESYADSHTPAENPPAPPAYTRGSPAAAPRQNRSDAAKQGN